MTDNPKKDDLAEPKAGAARPMKISRRGLLKAGATAMPAVLTLQSGAAMAASSAYIGSAPRSGDPVYCMDVRNAEPLPNGTTFRFVNTDYANYYELPNGTYHLKQGDKEFIYADEFCRIGGTRHLNDAGWPDATLPTNMNGILVSSTAMMSIGTALDLKKMPLS